MRTWARETRLLSLEAHLSLSSLAQISFASCCRKETHEEEIPGVRLLILRNLLASAPYSLLPPPTGPEDSQFRNGQTLARPRHE